jgi:hypothetical protein
MQCVDNTLIFLLLSLFVTHFLKLTEILKLLSVSFPVRGSPNLYYVLGRLWCTQEFLFVGGRVMPGIFLGGPQIHLRTEGRENEDLGVVAPLSGVPLNLQMNETHIFIRLLRMYFSWNWEFGSALSKLRNFEGGG